MNLRGYIQILRIRKLTAMDTSKRNDLYNDLNAIEALYNQNTITEENYKLQKALLLEKIEKLCNTETQESNNSNEFYNNYKRRSNTGLIILFFICSTVIAIMVYVMYDRNTNSFKLDNIKRAISVHSKDKEDIKIQIEKAYFGLVNGAFTSQAMQGAGPEELPFYNQKMGSLYVMGLMPFASLFGKINIEPKNIDVYEFISDNEARVRYDLIIIAGGSRDSAKIDMVVKKIGGDWKLDGEAFMGPKKQAPKKQAVEKVIARPKARLGNAIDETSD